MLREKSMVVLNNNKPFEVRVKQLALCLLDYDLSNIQIDQKVQKILMDIKNEKE